MLPTKTPPPPEVSPERAQIFQQWNGQLYTQLLIKQLGAENAKNVDQIVENFEAYSELQLKVALQRIKTQRNIILCLTNPLPHPPQK